MFLYSSEKLSRDFDSLVLRVLVSLRLDSLLLQVACVLVRSFLGRHGSLLAGRRQLGLFRRFLLLHLLGCFDAGSLLEAIQASE